MSTAFTYGAGVYGHTHNHNPSPEGAGALTVQRRPECQPHTQLSPPLPPLL